MPLAPDVVTPEVSIPVPPPEPLLLPPEPTQQRRRWLWPVVGVCAAALILGLGLLLVHRGTTGVGRQLASSALPDTILRLKGTTEAVQSRTVLAPVLEGQQVNTLTLVHLVPAGTRVKQGDPIAEFDRQAQTRDYFDKQAEYRKLEDQVVQEQSKETAARAKDETELENAENALSKAQLEVQKAEIVSKIDAEKNQETLDESKATYDQLRQTFDLKRKAAKAAIHILEIQRDRTKQTMEHAQANADLMQIHAPIDGVVVLNTIWKQGTMGEVQEGDQVEPGMPFMQVVNPASMQVRVMANQQDFPSLKIGQTAKVRLDAYPDLVFAAKVEQLAPIGENGSFSQKVRSFAVIVSIDGNHPKLMPDLSAAVDVDVPAQVAGSPAKPAAEGGS